MSKNQKANKTVETNASVDKFLLSVKDEKKREDSYTLIEMMKKITGLEPKMWGPAIIGFGTIHYKYASGREGDMPIAGFSPRKQALTVYLLRGFQKSTEMMKKLGKYKTGAVCLYMKSLDDVDLKVLKQLVTISVKLAKNHKWE